MSRYLNDSATRTSVTDAYHRTSAFELEDDRDELVGRREHRRSRRSVADDFAQDSSVAGVSRRGERRARTRPSGFSLIRGSRGNRDRDDDASSSRARGRRARLDEDSYQDSYSYQDDYQDDFVEEAEDDFAFEEAPTKKLRAKPKKHRGWSLITRTTSRRLDWDDWYGDDDEGEAEDDWYEADEPLGAYDDYAMEQDDLDAVGFAGDSFDESDDVAWDEGLGWDLAEVRRERLDRRRREGSFYDMGRGTPDYEVSRDWLYSGDERSFGLPGASRRRASVIGGLKAIPAGIASAFGAGFRALGNHPRIIFVLVMAVFTTGMLLEPARNLYVANRKIETLQTTYDELLEENDSIRSDLELLQTQEGVENEARSRGYVGAGETKVIIEGLSDEHAGEGKALSMLKKADAPDTRPWYTVALDQLFGYEPEA